MLEVQNLSVSYGQSSVIESLQLSIEKNETLAILGRNGMGKSTLLRALIGILPARTGKISLNGMELTKNESHERVARGLAYVPQGRGIFPSLTVEENIKTGLENAKDHRVPDEIYSLFPVLYEMRRRKGGNLSGGQQQQLAISRALVSNPSVLLLDEPTEGIQPSIIKDLAKALNEIKRLRKIAIVVSEQVLSFALDVADRILIIEKGRIVHENLRANVDAKKLSQYLSV
ncbi:MAG: urea ABC transporter ATP-binding subunit UrtE [Gammaproteobacteria bacterium]|nr:urea ABC transporter ATP-binding subunit UrtE [Gammaproteobacteria bacterium]